MINKINYFIILTVFSVQLNAQAYQLYTGSTPGETSIQMKWFSKKIALNSTFDIYRQKSGEGNWIKINKQPIQRATPLTEAQIEQEAKKSNRDNALISYSMAFLDQAEEHLNNLSLLHLSSIADNKLAEICGIYYKDNGVAIGETYNYKLTKSGSQDVLAKADKIAYTADRSSKTINKFKGVAGDKKVDIYFEYQSDFPLYKIYRGKTNKNYDTSFYCIPSVDQIKASQQNKPIYSDVSKNLKVGNTYTYVLVGMDHFGIETPYSQEITVQIMDMTPPPSVQGLRANYRDPNIIDLNWRKPSAIIKKIDLYKSKERNGVYEKISIQKDSFYIDKSIVESSKYYYFIAAENSNGIASYTDTIICGTPDRTPPSIPAGFNAKSDTGIIYLTWNKNTESDLQGYFIFRALSTDPRNFTPLIKVPILENSYRDIQPKEAGNSFFYKICAVDQSYNRSKTTSPISISMPNIVAPTQPNITSAVFENNTNKISWTPNFEKDFKQFELYRGTKINDTTFGNYGMIYSTINQTNYIDKGITDGNLYSYYVVAIDSSNNKSISTTMVIESTTFQSAKSIKNLQASKGEKVIKVSWKNTTKQKVQLLKKTGLGTFISITPPMESEMYDDINIESGYEYQYKVRSFGNDDSEIDSEIIKIKID